MGAARFISVNQPLPPDVFKLAVERAFNQIIITDTEGVIVYANQGVKRLTGFDPKEVIGQKPSIWGRNMDADFYQSMWKRIKTDKQPFHGEVKNHRKDGSEYFALLTITPITDNLGEVAGFIGVEEEITAYKK
ncbi:PAS domain S-box protein [Candidatus Microgenomates bacterium]|nr:MAG: PAS domain S-box protein [Candidatus Microgenomates bacterium]